MYAHIIIGNMPKYAFFQWLCYLWIHRIYYLMDCSFVVIFLAVVCPSVLCNKTRVLSHIHIRPYSREISPSRLVCNWVRTPQTHTASPNCIEASLHLQRMKMYVKLFSLNMYHGKWQDILFPSGHIIPPMLYILYALFFLPPIFFWPPTNFERNTTFILERAIYNVWISIL